MSQTHALRIVIAEDDAFVRQNLFDVLSNSGHLVLTTHNGRAAYDEIVNSESRGEIIDLLITDVQMPELNGVQLLEAIENESIYLPVLAMSGYGDKELLLQLMQRGCREYLDKPFAPATLLKRIEDLMEKERKYRYSFNKYIEKLSQIRPNPVSHSFYTNKDLTIRTRELGGFVVVDVKGELVSDAALKVRDAVESVLAKGILNIMINFTQVRLINNFGMGAIVFLWKQIQEKKGVLRLVSGNAYLKSKLQDLNLGRVITIYHDEEEFIDHEGITAVSA
ncbi:MAG: hypothetical protein A2268_07585 [Candidatus Raymondbacteria bacterium RifOxyA12_full_50_37]|uniref:Response regulatory domain-containing protein n=1 Tax=Candidatus Raymondbacteria bacterium RIFOXYD12_FULL_49_13 TaxID=1817890 RepID=A0A1F7F321_UNCRA|nr:MAG: hypothetical protein A2248_05195 [Candidatus Raymondbacteria bacterium RIFOXYA2_FULL_49_16]OGJ90106.1 MAG: hypothetical protein A2268_07585 [Candidatus Raymondbacteria bacterium RifOxyA12_full_50_37]OGJ94659.1 MAG: hypothetical protein A2350_08430 [Candidatus Raymondbacteria bacterium RifOxyB12_full_50_8]OGJ97684.1 MAG: hypothetical protein A2453_09555 [Candidatus Raymondbacteria bacterium RIFOXYC2_FULL_50_21]OGK01049.1 MAG: hypothetical protein A2519_16825 [Candidatus Raymondbacteria b